MPVCEIHGEFITHPLGCTRCQWINSERNKKEKRFSSVKKFKESGSERKKLKEKLQSLVSAKMKKIYRDKGLYYCWIDGTIDTRSGLKGLHVSHYFAKSDIWQLWDDPVNCGISSYNRNVVRPETVALMRRMMAKVWGEDSVKDLEERAEKHRQNIRLGIEPRHPPDIWLMAKIKELSKK